MSAPACPTCGGSHGPDQRYCLACGSLVGRRSVDLEQAFAYERERQAARPSTPAAALGSTPALDASRPTGTAGTTPAPAPVVPPTPVGELSLWRRPATSILTMLALATGVTAGFLLEPQGGSATGSPTALSGPAVVPATTTAAAAAPTAAAAAPQADDAAQDDAAAASDAADGAATPAATATAEPAATPVSAVATPTTDDAATPAASAPAASAKKTDAAPQRRSTKATSGDRKGGTDTDRTDAKPAAAAGLPRIEHIWVIGIGAPVAARDGGYLGEALLADGTELPRYTPAAADPVAGAAALVAGRAPSAGAKTIVSQLAVAKRPWRAYAPGAPSCGDAPTVNPLLAFGSVTSAADCADGVAGLTALPADLKDADAAPAFSYVTTDATLDPAALDEQLKQVVEPIRRSAAYKRSGLIAIVPTAASPVAPTGALLLSPFAAGSTSIGTAVGPYSLLRTFQDLLGLDRLGHAADADVRALGPDVLSPED